MKYLLSCLILVASAAIAQTPPAAPPAEQLAAIERLGWLVGEWEGTSSFQRPEGRSEVLSWERVTRAAGGAALLVEGRHYVRQPDGSRGPIVHDAAALITYDAAARRYRFHSQLSNGQFGMHAGEVRGDAFMWWIETPRGLIRYWISRDAEGRWLERGESCPVSDKPDTPCQPFFSMSLRKVAGRG